jgi:outer membrane autotransporter protein
MNTMESDGGSARSLTSGASLGWQRLTSGHTPGARQKSYLGVMLGQANNRQKYGISDYGSGPVENKTTATVAGIYGLHVNRPESASAWYGQWSLLYGGLNYRNEVPGEIAGAGLTQRYDGTIGILTLENGVSFRQKNGWLLEPQLQFSYIHIQQKDFRDNLGAQISLRQGDSLWGRLGFEARRSMGRTPERKSCYWARVSYSREFLARNEVDVAGDLGRSVASRDAFAAALGTSLQLGRNVGLQAEAVQYFGGDKGVQAQLSVNYSW